MRKDTGWDESVDSVSLAPQFTWYPVYWVLRVLVPRDCFQVVYIFALHSSLNTSTFCFLHVFPVTYLTDRMEQRVDCIVLYRESPAWQGLAVTSRSSTSLPVVDSDSWVLSFLCWTWPYTYTLWGTTCSIRAIPNTATKWPVTSWWYQHNLGQIRVWCWYPCLENGYTVQPRSILITDSNRFSTCCFKFINFVRSAPLFTRYIVNCVSYDVLSRVYFKIVYMFAPCSSLNAATLCLLCVFPLPYLTYSINRQSTLQSHQSIHQSIGNN